MCLFNKARSKVKRPQQSFCNNIYCYGYCKLIWLANVNICNLCPVTAHCPVLLNKPDVVLHRQCMTRVIMNISSSNFLIMHQYLGTQYVWLSNSCNICLLIVEFFFLNVFFWVSFSMGLFMYWNVAFLELQFSTIYRVSLCENYLKGKWLQKVMCCL